MKKKPDSKKSKKRGKNNGLLTIPEAEEEPSMAVRHNKIQRESQNEPLWFSLFSLFFQPFPPPFSAVGCHQRLVRNCYHSNRDGKVQLTLEMFNSSQLSIKVQYGRRDGAVPSGPFPRKRCTELVCPGKWIQQRKAPA